MEKIGRSLSDLNNALVTKYLKAKTLNYVNIIASNTEHHLGIIGVCSPKKAFIKFNNDLTIVPVTENDALYYGLSPVIDSRKIIEQISQLNFSTTAGLDNFIKDNADCFMLHDDQSKYLLSFSRYLIVAFAYNFSVSFLLNDSLFQRLKTFTDSTYHTIVKSDNVLSIKGCPTEEILKQLQNCYFKKVTQLQVADDGSETEVTLWEISDDGTKTIEEIYQDLSNIKYADGHVFYSGTLFRPVEFEVRPDYFENSNTETIICHFEQTSYATVFALDHDLSRHPLLSKDNSGQLIREIFSNDNDLICALSKSLNNLHCNGTQERLNFINEYLAKCFNVNQIGVSANITSSDDYLLMGVRSTNSIDQNCLYPGVNGNAEIADSNVSFYQWNATAEDFPTIELTCRTIRFNSEIQREASEELQIESDVKSFRTCALIISGICPEEGKSYNADNPRRLHFNILYDHQSNNTLTELMHEGENANESFENQGFLGVRINVYNGFFEKIKFVSRSLLHIIIDNNDLWESILLLVVAVSQLLTIGHSQFGISDWVQFILALLVICVDFYKFKKWINHFKHRKHYCVQINIDTKHDYEHIDRIIQKSILRDYHPVAIAALLYKIEQKIHVRS